MKAADLRLEADWDITEVAAAISPRACTVLISTLKDLAGLHKVNATKAASIFHDKLLVCLPWVDNELFFIVHLVFVAVIYDKLGRVAILELLVDKRNEV